MATFERVFCVSGTDVDPGNHVRADALALMLQESAAHHADSWGMSIGNLMKEGRTWVQARIAIEFDGERPGWKDELRVTTWSGGFRGHIATRDSVITRAGAGTTEGGGEIVARASSAWFVLDITSRRPVRLADYAGKDETEEGRSSGAKIVGKIDLPPTPPAETPLAVRASDLDQNGHVNNVRYIEWLYEGIPAAVLASKRMSRIEIHYLGETRYPETVTIRTWAEGEDFIESILRADGTEVIRSRSTWKPLA